MDGNTRKWYGIAAAIIVIFIAIAWYLGANNKAVAPTTSGTATSTNATTTSQDGSTTGGIQIGVGGDSNFPQPDLNRPYTPPSTAPASVQAADKKAVADAIAQLKIDPTHEAYWLQLASYRKLANDFAGAEEIWIFCTKVFPKDPIAYNNLGDLYANYTHDYTKAAMYWNGAIKLDPTSISTYRNLATMYDISMKDKANAQATLQAGLKANPGNPDLKYALEHLQ